MLIISKEQKIKWCAVKLQYSILLKHRYLAWTSNLLQILSTSAYKSLWDITITLHWFPHHAPMEKWYSTKWTDVFAHWYYVMVVISQFAEKLQLQLRLWTEFSPFYIYLMVILYKNLLPDSVHNVIWQYFLLIISAIAGMMAQHVNFHGVPQTTHPSASQTETFGGYCFTV